jgi:hypothetical protein
MNEIHLTQHEWLDLYAVVQDRVRWTDEGWVIVAVLDRDIRLRVVLEDVDR